MNSNDGTNALENNQLTLINVTDSNAIDKTLENLSKPLADFLNFHQLPIKDVLAENKEKTKLFNSFNDAIECLPLEERVKAKYLTKFVVAVAGGLFDGALSYLWNEAIKSIRELIVSYDLLYFYSVAEQKNSRYKNLSSEDDLVYISDHDLLEISRRIGLIDDYGFKVLENINYLRNHASSAHPNGNELTGIKLLSLLEDCIKYAILIEPNISVVKIKQLFENLRKNEIPIEDFEAIAIELRKQPQIRIDDFLSSIFGLYCDEGKDSYVYSNIEGICKLIWLDVSEEVKYAIGSKYGFHRVNGDVEKKKRVNQFLEKVDGMKYKDKDSIAAEMLEKLQQLKTVHFGVNNFYNEYSYAYDIEKIIPKTGVPESVQQMFIKTICICYAGNGYGSREGTDENATVIYKRIIERFDNEDIKKFILLFKDIEFTVDFYKSKPDRRIRAICNKLKEQTKNTDLQNALDVLLKHPTGKLNTVSVTADYLAVTEKLKT